MTSGDAAACIAEWAPAFRNDHFDEMLTDVGLERAELADATPVEALSFFYRLYGFNRAGGQQAGYPRFAVAALERVGELDAERLWQEFQWECEDAGVGVNERINRGVVTGSAELARSEGNLFTWASSKVKDESVSAPYEEVESITGIGPKIARFFIRDAVWVNGVEDEVDSGKGHFLQPVDVWVRKTAETLWPDLRNEAAGQVTVSKRIARECRSAGVSGVAFNQGAWYYCAVECGGEEDAVEQGLSELVDGV